MSGLLIGGGVPLCSPLTSGIRHLLQRGGKLGAEVPHGVVIWLYICCANLSMPPPKKKQIKSFPSFDSIIPGKGND